MDRLRPLCRLEWKILTAGTSGLRSREVLLFLEGRHAIYCAAALRPETGPAVGLLPGLCRADGPRREHRRLCSVSRAEERIAEAETPQSKG